MTLRVETANLSLQAVSVHAGSKALLKNISLRLCEGELLAVVGPNGAGKSTLLRCALGLQRHSAGRVQLSGKALNEYSGRERAAQIAWLPQSEPMLEAICAIDLVASARFRFDESRAVALKHADQALERLGIAELRQRTVNTLSGGERRRVFMACVLAQDSPLILLDEPANHLDPASQLELYDFIAALCSEGRGLLCITHDINLLNRFEHLPVRVLGLKGGQIAFDMGLSAPELPDALSNLFGLRYAPVTAPDGRRHLLSIEEPRNGDA